MEAKRIIYYSGNDEKRETLSLRCFCLREGFELKDIFYAVKDAKNAQDLLNNMRDIILDKISFVEETVCSITFCVHNCYGNNNYFKIRKLPE